MKKPTSYNKAANLTAPRPEPNQPPSQEARATNNKPTTNQTETLQQAGFSSELTIRIPKSLRAQLANQAAEEGISLNEYLIYRLSQQP